MFFRLSSVELWLLIFGIVLGVTFLGVAAGRRLRAHAEALREPVGVLQGALLGLVALLLAFGLTLAVGRYDARRAAVVDSANAIGTTYLRAQTLREPVRTRSLELLRRYTDATIRLPGRSRKARMPTVRSRTGIDWSVGLATRRPGARRLTHGQRAAPLRRDPEPDDRHADRAGLGANNRVPGAVLVFEVLGAAVALGLLALYLAILARGVVSVVACGRVRLDAAADHLRPRSPGPRARTRPRRPARQPPRLDAAPAGGARADRAITALAKPVAQHPAHRTG